MLASRTISRRTLVSSLAIMLAAPSSFAQSSTGQSKKAELRFNGTRFFHRWSKDRLHEFTPEGEDNLGRWQNMVTINQHKTARNGEQLAEVANRIVDNYRRHGRIVKTASKPATASQPAEHLAVVIFARPEFIEIAFTRMLLAKGSGLVVTYSRRVHGRAAGPETSEWLIANGPRVEAALLGWAEHEMLEAYEFA